MKITPIALNAWFEIKRTTFLWSNNAVLYLNLLFCSCKQKTCIDVIMLLFADVLFLTGYNFKNVPTDKITNNNSNTEKAQM